SLEPRVLLLQRSESLGFADFHPAKLPLPRMVGGRTDVVRCADRLDWASGLRFSQDPNDLFFAESTSLHLLLLLEQNFTYVTSPFWGSGHHLATNEDRSAIPASTSGQGLGKRGRASISDRRRHSGHNLIA